MVEPLVRAQAAAAFRAEPIALDRKTTSAQALVVIASSCLRQVALNQRGVCDGGGEAVHQVRVGVRRLRAALAIFENVLGPGEFDDLKRELVWLAEQLASARDYDVLLESKRKFADPSRSAVVGESELTSELNRRQQEAFAVASGAAESARFERLVASAAVALLSRAGDDGKGARPVRKLARRVLARRTRHALRRLARLPKLSVRERHQLRIAIKKLRYGADFFAQLFPGRKSERFNRALEALQDVLGKLNDIAVHEQLLADFSNDGESDAHASRRIAFAMGAWVGHERAELRSLLAAVPKLRARLAEAPRFWR